ncbi:hypothetical protein PF005_g19620 [Phytophthora fragariae]|uniref:Uncharacterized protein n=1 Tax=Phytophthora fragariae TaxID=53985 RepID=A0A6A3R4T3_9STRA|nr:hypothetical protein PF003_g31484 [Phytophthora fragariae]KAE8929282.1 hypothetical protein PF009_g20596 [Phytophthora fragariae]KAE8989783.1 hypothetical protein PF011_g18625 [Phytophthora fragariae]KAE9089129.1 hypothetical protein PF010_g19120 [Phytophthora fragariae]KAE9089136.1 hypothetical protein PF007_g19705 [Phytophthora fragariae]
MIPPYPGPTPPDSDEGDDDAEQVEKSEDNPPSPDPKRDAPRGKEPREPQSGSKRRASAQRSVEVDVQCRPTVHPESDVGPRSSSEALPFTISDACALLPEFIAWEDLRPDVQWAMRTGLGYDEAVEIMLADTAQHALFHRDSLCDMLATMMYRHKFDDTLWAMYVPTAYYVMAEVILENWLERGVVPPEWPDLHNLTEDLPEVIDSSSSEEGTIRRILISIAPLRKMKRRTRPRQTQRVLGLLRQTATSWCYDPSASSRSKEYTLPRTLLGAALKLRPRLSSTLRLRSVLANHVLA